MASVTAQYVIKSAVNKLSSKVLHASKFAVFKRLSVWRDSVDDLLKQAELFAQWTEDI